MKNLGLLLIGIGFIAGAFTAVVDPEKINWTIFAACALVGAVGVALVQVAIRKSATDKDRLASDIEALTASLKSIVESARNLDENKELDVYDLPGLIEENFDKPIQRFVDARESLMHIYSVELYAEVMSEFAAGERVLNRVWSSAAEGYIDEAHSSLSRCRSHFENAEATLKAAG